jgi:hypothetical protein
MEAARARLLSSGAPLSAPGAGGGAGDSARSGIRASELRTLGERSEPELLTERGSSEGDDPLARVWAGVRPGASRNPKLEIRNPISSGQRLVATEDRKGREDTGGRERRVQGGESWRVEGGASFFKNLKF